MNRVYKKNKSTSPNVPHERGDEPYCEECLPNGILGLNTNLLREYIQYLADRRFERLRLSKQLWKRQSFPMDE